MNIFSSLLLPKYACHAVRMTVVSSPHLFSVLNFSTNSSPDFERRKHGSETSSKSVNFRTESDNFGTLKPHLDKQEKFSPRISTKLHKHGNKIRVTKIRIPQEDESDVFGNLSEKGLMWYPDMYEPSKIDNDVSDDSVIVKNISKKFRCPHQYMKEMKRLVKEKKVKEALNLFVDMRRNYVNPIHSHFNYMIGVCGRIGYTEMAFNLLRQMTDRSFQPTPATLTGLFNSCAESPFPEYGLKKARLLKEKIETKNWTVNLITYHAMIKAFGKCGDLGTAFEIVDEMEKAGFQIDVDTYSFLLMSCVANKENGFTYAVEVWRKMKARKCLPNIFTCNLLLRAARDCDVGPQEISSLLLQHWSSYSKRPYGFLTKESLTTEAVIKLNNNATECSSSTEGSSKYSVESAQNETSGQNEPKYELVSVVKSSVTTTNPQTAATNLLAVRPVSGPEILELMDIKTSSDRLILIGGLEGFLETMSSAKVKPDIKTFTLLLQCLPPNIQEEEKLLSYIDSYKIKPDVDFFNMLIKRRNYRKETEAAKNVLVLINKYGLTPNIMTFGVLALGCRTLQQATLFLSEMKKMGSCPNAEIAGTLLRNACVSLDFPYMAYVMRRMVELRIQANEKFILTLEKMLVDVRKNILLMEQGKKVEEFYQRPNLQEDFKEFNQMYDGWLKKVRLATEQHPWLQYRTDIIDRPKKEVL